MLISAVLNFSTIEFHIGNDLPFIVFLPTYAATACYADFKIGVILRQARESAGLTQEELARRLKTKKSSISRIENHADDVRLSTLRRYADAVGANLQIRLANS